MPRMPVVFFGHGSPMVAIQANDTSRSWAAVAAALPRPTSILAVSAHWETNVTAVTAMAQPKTIHDFGASFPKALFDKQYPAPGDPALARRVAELLAPTPVALDPGQWGLDHGTWSVLTHAYPKADIPVVQLGLGLNLSPAERFDIGRRLAPLRDEGVLILGTGNIVHNLPAMNWSDAACAPFDWAQRFNDEMRKAIVDDEPERAVLFGKLGRDAQMAAPTPEHFWPLLYILGTRGPNDRAKLFNDRIEHGSLGMTSFIFEDMREAKAA
ncbi:MAG: Extradiol ring-cleavage dioxygenase class protein subunit [Phenylobacterium sp.]|nr:Extradiol ring-cleavage dioxygenase class protein subunit [Phenylobacterium sp.]